MFVKYFIVRFFLDKFRKIYSYFNIISILFIIIDCFKYENRRKTETNFVGWRLGVGVGPTTRGDYPLTALEALFPFHLIIIINIQMKLLWILSVMCRSNSISSSSIWVWGRKPLSIQDKEIFWQLWRRRNGIKVWRDISPGTIF